jgi:hypothetical protein
VKNLTALLFFFFRRNTDICTDCFLRSALFAGTGKKDAE